MEDEIEDKDTNDRFIVLSDMILLLGKLSEKDRNWTVMQLKNLTSEVRTRTKKIKLVG